MISTVALTDTLAWYSLDELLTPEESFRNWISGKVV
jgi:hypothetical protein